jgi:hypothetical protein
MARTDRIKDGMERMRGILLTKKEKEALDGLIKAMERRKDALGSYDGDPEIAVLLLAVLSLTARMEELDSPMRCVGP